MSADVLATVNKTTNLIKRARLYLSREGLGPVLVKAVSGSAVVRIVGMIFGFLVGIQLARGLGAEGYGVYGLAMSVIAILTVPTQFGLPQLITREIANAKAQSDWSTVRSIIRWATRASLVLASIVVTVVLAWLILQHQLESPLGKALIAGLALVPLVALLSLRSAALCGLQKIVLGQFPEVALRPALHSLLLFMVSIAVCPLTPALAIGLGGFAAAIALLLTHRLLLRALPVLVTASKFHINPRQWWLSAVPMAMTEGMRLLQAHILIFFLGSMVALSDVGIFRMAVSVVAFVAMPLSLFNIVSMPIVAKLHSVGQKAKLQKMLTWVSAGMLTGVILLSLPFFLAGEWLLGAVFGDEYSPGSSALVIFCVGAMVNAVFGINAVLLNMTGHQRKVTVASGAALAVLILVSPPLILMYGIEGAAVSNLLSAITWNLVMWRNCRQLLDLEPGLWSAFVKTRR